MSTTPEGLLKLKIKEYLTSLGPDCFWFMPMMMGYGKKGIPDFVTCYRGRWVSIETKVQGRKEKPWQKQRAEEIMLAGGVHIVAYELGNVQIVFEPLRKVQNALQRSP